MAAYVRAFDEGAEATRQVQSEDPGQYDYTHPLGVPPVCRAFLIVATPYLSPKVMLCEHAVLPVKTFEHTLSSVRLCRPVGAERAGLDVLRLSLREALRCVLGLESKERAADLAYCSLHQDQAHAKKASWNRFVDSVDEVVAFGRQSGDCVVDVSLDFNCHDRKDVPGFESRSSRLTDEPPTNGLTGRELRRA